MSDTQPKRAPDGQCLGWATSSRGRCGRDIPKTRLKADCLTCGTHREFEKKLQADFDLEAFKGDPTYHRRFFKKHFPQLFRLPASIVHLRSRGLQINPVSVNVAFDENAPLQIVNGPPEPLIPAASAYGAGGGTTGSGTDDKSSDKPWNLKDIAGLTTIFGVVLLGLAAAANFYVYKKYDVQYFLIATRTDHLQAAFELGPWVAIPLGILVLCAFIKDLSFLFCHIIIIVCYIMAITCSCIVFVFISIARVPVEVIAMVPWLGSRFAGAVSAVRRAFESTNDFVVRLSSECSSTAREATRIGESLRNFHFLDLVGWMSHRAGPFIAFAAIAVAATLMAFAKTNTIDSDENRYLVCSKPFLDKQPVKLLGRISNYTLVRYSDGEMSENYIIPTDTIHSFRSATDSGAVAAECPRESESGASRIGVAAFLFDQRDDAVSVKPAAAGALNFFYFVDGTPVALGPGRFALPIFPSSVRAKFITDEERREFGAQGDWPGVDSVEEAYAFGFHYNSTLNYVTTGYEDQDPVDFLEDFVEGLKSCSSSSEPLRIRVIGYSSDAAFRKEPPSTEDLPNSDALNHALAEGRRALVLKVLGFKLPGLAAADHDHKPAVSEDGSLELVGKDGEPVTALPPDVYISKEQFAKLRELLIPPGAAEPLKSAATNPAKFRFHFTGFEELVASRKGAPDGVLAVQSILPRSVVVEILGGGNGECAK